VCFRDARTHSHNVISIQVHNILYLCYLLDENAGELKSNIETAGYFESHKIYSYRKRRQNKMTVEMCDEARGGNDFSEVCRLFSSELGKCSNSELDRRFGLELGKCSNSELEDASV
jgi:hypothetical protein